MFTPKSCRQCEGDPVPGRGCLLDIWQRAGMPPRWRRQKKRQPEAAFGVAGARSHFLRPTRANLLRNFSTRPPRLSTLFCVPV